MLITCDITPSTGGIEDARRGGSGGFASVLLQEAGQEAEKHDGVAEHRDVPGTDLLASDGSKPRSKEEQPRKSVPDVVHPLWLRVRSRTATSDVLREE